MTYEEETLKRIKDITRRLLGAIPKHHTCESGNVGSNEDYRRWLATTRDCARCNWIRRQDPTALPIKRRAGEL